MVVLMQRFLIVGCLVSSFIAWRLNSWSFDMHLKSTLVRTPCLSAVVWKPEVCRRRFQAYGKSFLPLYAKFSVCLSGLDFHEISLTCLPVSLLRCLLPKYVSLISSISFVLMVGIQILEYTKHVKPSHSVSWS